MTKYLRSLLLLLVTLYITPALATAPADSAYLDGGSSDSALILAHGRGHGPTWLVVEPLREGVHDKLGYHTLSLQMPADEDKHWKEYAEDFPEAYKTFDKAVRFLQQEKKVKKIYLMGHSMGSRMAAAYMTEAPNPAINGLIIIGCRNNGGEPLDCAENVSGLKIPLLDLWGDGSRKDERAGEERAELVSATYKQVIIDGATHKFEGYEDDLVDAVVKWLKQVNKKAP